MGGETATDGSYMKKSIYLFCTRLWYYLTALPLAVILVFAIIYNSGAKNLLKLYPLIVITALGICFIFIYFFRAVKLSGDRIRKLGLFSGRDSALIVEGRELAITLERRKRAKIELFGHDEAPALDWIDEERYKDMSVNLFRARVKGGKRAVKKIVSLFGATKDEAARLLESRSYECENDAVRISASESESIRTVRIAFKATI